MIFISVLIQRKCERALFLAVIDRLIADPYCTKKKSDKIYISKSGH